MPMRSPGWSPDDLDSSDDEEQDGSLGVNIGFPDLDISGDGNGNEVSDETDDQGESESEDETVGPVEAFTGQSWEYTGLPDDWGKGTTAYRQETEDPDQGTMEEIEEDPQVQESRERIEELQEEGDTLGVISEQGAIATEYIFDRPGMSIQNATMDALTAAQNRPLTGSSFIANLVTEEATGAEVKSDDEVTEEEAAENLQEGFIGLREDIPESLAEAGEGTPFDPDAGYEVGVPGTNRTFNTGVYSDKLASAGGGITDYFVLEPVGSAIHTLTGVDPTGGYEPGLPYIADPESGEITGETDTINRQWWEPVFDIAGFGVSALAAGVLGRAGLKATAEATGRSDEVGRLISQGTQTGEQGTMAIWDDALRLSDELASGVDEGVAPVGRTVESGSPVSEDLLRIDFGPNTADDATRLSDTAVDEAVDNPVMGPADETFGPALDELGETIQGSDETLGIFDETGGSALDETFGPSLDELSETISREADDTVGIFDDVGSTGDEGFEGISGFSANEVTRGADDVTSAADEGWFTRNIGNPLGSAWDEVVSGTGRTADEAGSASDEVAETVSRTSDDVNRLYPSGPSDELGEFGTRAADDATRPFDNMPTGAADEGQSFLSRITPGRAGAALGGSILGAAGLSALGFGGGMGGPGQTENGAWSHEQVATFQADNGRQAVAYAVYQAGERRGIAVVTSVEPLKTLSQNGSERRANTSYSAWTNGQEGEYLIPEFASVSQARQTFLAWAGEDGGGPPNESEAWDGTLSAPGNVARGEGFNAEAEVTNQSDQQAQGVFGLGIATPEGLSSLGRQRATVEARGSTTITFQIEQVTSTLPPNEYTLVLVGQDGRIDSTSVTVGDEEEEEGEWGAWETVGQLGNGWYVMGQQHRTEQRTRFVGVGKRSDGTRIYLHPSGRARREPHYYESEQAVQRAYQAWVQRKSSGEAGEDETPNASGGRPSSSGVARDTQGSSGSLSLSGITDTLTSPVGIAGMVIIAIAIYYVSGGQPIQWLQQQWKAVEQEFSGVLQ